MRTLSGAISFLEHLLNSIRTLAARRLIVAKAHRFQHSTQTLSDRWSNLRANASIAQRQCGVVDRSGNVRMAQVQEIRGGEKVVA